MAATEQTSEISRLTAIVERGFTSVAADIAAANEKLDGLKSEMLEQFEHVDERFRATQDRLRDISSEIAVIHRRIERLEEQGASNAGFAKEIDHLLARLAEIEKHLSLDKKIAA